MKKAKEIFMEKYLFGNVKSISGTVYEATANIGEINKDSISYSYISTYNNNNHIETVVYFEDGLNKKFTSKYDDKGNLIEDNDYGTDGQLIKKIIYFYDDEGNKIEKMSSCNNPSLGYIIKYKYDNNGNIIEANEYDGDCMLPFKFTYKYDDNANKIEENSYYTDGSFRSKCIYKYDNKGNMIERNEYMADGSLSQISYRHDDFDNEGNWCKEIEFFDNKPWSIRTRKIEYCNQCGSVN